MGEVHLYNTQTPKPTLKTQIPKPKIMDPYPKNLDTQL